MGFSHCQEYFIFMVFDTGQMKIKTGTLYGGGGMLMDIGFPF